MDQAPRTPTVAPLTRRYTPHLLVAGPSSLPPQAVERARRLDGVAGVTVVDAARAQVGGRRMGLLGVDPSGFRAFAPGPTAESDQLWQTIALGGLAVSFEQGRDALPLGSVVTAGRSASPGRVRVGAYASMGIGDIDAVVSRPAGPRARHAGRERPRHQRPEGRYREAGEAAAADPAARHEGGGAGDAEVPRRIREAEEPAAGHGASGRGVRRPHPHHRQHDDPHDADRPAGDRRHVRPVPGDRLPPLHRRPAGPRRRPRLRLHGEHRRPDAERGRPAARRPGRRVRRGQRAPLGISYVIWKQRIWNVRGGGWRPMEDRGSITQNHYDHVHISVLR
ncbi:hypothetical protein [Actinomadura madurae]|uniref:hypothetical protein n=1 Tax=Actinomadura madurae TaxID=1993 RepID=UPI003555F473